MPNLDPNLFPEWGSQASTSVLTKGGSLNKEIAKIASENDLNPAQIKRVCEAANLKTYQALFFNNRDKALDFDIASAEKVASELESVPVIPIISDYLSAPSFHKTAEDKDINKIFGVDSISNEPDVQERIKIASSFGRTLNIANKEARVRLYEVEMKKEAAENDLYSNMKQMVLLGEDFKKLASVAMDYADYDVKPMLASIYDRFKSSGVFGVREKTAQLDGKTIIDQVAEQNKAKVGPKSKINIINNKHPMIQNIDTIGEQKNDEDALRKSVWLLKDSVKVVEKKVQDLSGSVQRDKYVKDLLGENDSPTKTYNSFVHSPG